MKYIKTFENKGLNSFMDKDFTNFKYEVGDIVRWCTIEAPYVIIELSKGWDYGKYYKIKAIENLTNTSEVWDQEENIYPFSEEEWELTKTAKKYNL